VAARARSAPGLSAWDDLDRSLPEPEPASLGRPDDLKAIADEQDFADILLVVQAAWSEGDVMAMRGHITPDMATYFDRRLAQNIDNGIENRVVDVSNVRVERLSDWEEDGLHYAKARMRWRALDYIIDMSKLPDEPGYIIDGSPEKPLDSEEVWTFVKSPDGAWVLCEVEQGA
jgi:predicted lipid-binding transport protein (Tim44 family)